MLIWGTSGQNYESQVLSGESRQSLLSLGGGVALGGTCHPELPSLSLMGNGSPFLVLSICSNLC